MAGRTGVRHAHVGPSRPARAHRQIGSMVEIRPAAARPHKVSARRTRRVADLPHRRAISARMPAAAGEIRRRGTSPDAAPAATAAGVPPTAGGTAPAAADMPH